VSPAAARRPPPAARVCLVALAAASLAACQTPGGPQAAGDVTGATTGTVAAALTANPALGAAVGIGTRAVVDAGLAYVGRRRQRSEQDALAAAVGAMRVGEARAWRAPGGPPWRGRRGEVRVLRAAETRLASCKEVAFSVAAGGDDPPARRWFVTTACRHAEGWRWAAAEPATTRWGDLQ
jgi:hypothetical protein